MTISMIWAQSRDGWIGKDGDIPWDVPEDRASFARLTDGGVVVMGRRTWESLPDSVRPLKDRLNIVLRGDVDPPEDGAMTANSVDSILHLRARYPSMMEDLWVIGGHRVYEAFMPFARRLVITHVDITVDGDTPAPVVPDPDRWTCLSSPSWRPSKTGIPYRIVTMEKRP